MSTKNIETSDKATSINLLNFSTPQMRAFHLTWFSFFMCFFAWFGVAPLMPVIRDELHLTKQQIATTMIASVTITIFGRLFTGWLCDKVGPRISYTLLLTFCSLPVMLIGLAYNYETFIIFRLMIGAIGASFVITQYHTSVMFASNCVGTANATTAGWGNLGGGVTQMVMPVLFATFVGFECSTSLSWRLSMLTVGIMCFLLGIAYFFLTTDFPNGNIKELRQKGELKKSTESKGLFIMACKDYRAWSLFALYGACFGIELTINNMAALYYVDYFNLSMEMAGLIASLFGLMNLFARTLGGVFGDRFGKKGLNSRATWLFITVLCEGLCLIWFSRMSYLPLAIVSMIIFSLFVQMSEGATYSVVPFLNKKCLGSISGIVGAGGNMGALSAQSLLMTDMTWPTIYLILGVCVSAISFLAFTVKFSKEDEEEAKRQEALLGIS